jgi:hypothetical protein
MVVCADVDRLMGECMPKRGSGFRVMEVKCYLAMIWPTVVKIFGWENIFLLAKYGVHPLSSLVVLG